MNYLQSTPDGRLHLGEIVRPVQGRIGLSGEIEAIVVEYGWVWIRFGPHNWYRAELFRSINHPGRSTQNGKWIGRTWCNNAGCLRSKYPCYRCQPRMNEIIKAMSRGVEPQTHRTINRHYCKK